MRLTQAHEVVDFNSAGCRSQGIAACPIPDSSKRDQLLPLCGGLGLL